MSLGPGPKANKAIRERRAPKALPGPKGIREMMDFVVFKAWLDPVPKAILAIKALKATKVLGV